jgi:hypothetical protein
VETVVTHFSDLPNWDSPSAMQVYSLLHPNAPAKRTQAGQVCVCTAVKSVGPCRIWRVRPIVQCQRHRAVYKEEGRYADADPLYKRALATWKKALGPDHPDVAQSLNNLADRISPRVATSMPSGRWRQHQSRRGVPSVLRCVLSWSERIRLGSVLRRSLRSTTDRSR